MKVRGAATAFVALSWSACVFSAPPVELGQMQIREFDSSLGEWHQRFQRNPDFFDGRNWRGVESGGSNDDLEILIPLVGSPGSDVSQPLVVTVTSRRSRKIIESRRFVGVKLPDAGTAYQSILLRDAACLGLLDVVAKLGTQKKALILGLDCGE